VAVSSVDLDNEERLAHVCDLQVIGLQEVLGDAHLLAVLRVKAEGDGVLDELNVLNEVAAFVAIGTDHRFELELVADASLFVSELGCLLNLVDPL
jgi:hypothetical protein